MTLIAGVDIGNSTTEIVIQDGGAPVAWGRRPTRGTKGSAGSVQAAAALLRAIEAENDIRVDRVLVAPWRPVTTALTRVAEPPPDTGRVQVLDCAGHSVSGDDAVVGTPWDVSGQPPDARSVIAVVPPGIGYRQAVARIGEMAARGCPVSGVAAARDEAVLIASRLGLDIPVVDGIDTRSALGCTRLLVEVRASGQCVRTACDAFALKTLLGVDDRHADAVSLVARWVRDERAVVVGLREAGAGGDEKPATNRTITWRSGETVDLFDAIALLASRPVGAVTTCALPRTQAVSDLWGVDITRVVAERGIRSPGRNREVVLASLSGEHPDPVENLSATFGVPVDVAGSEAEAASTGARTTPGLTAGALVLDIGGGTIDLVGEDGVTAAGGGEMLSAAVANVLDVPRGAADWIKRAPARRVESPKVLLNEDGSRHFASEDEPPVPPRLVGTLVTRGPSGYASFGGALQPAEWRIIRQSLKLEVIAKNVGRVIQTYRDKVRRSGMVDVVIVGGPAGDDELLPAIGRLENVASFGRGNVAGRLGHRYAVAYGLTLLGG